MESASHSTSPSAENLAGERGEFLSELHDSKEEKPEDPAWIEAKALLAQRLSNFQLTTWVEPLIFEHRDAQAVLRLPNDFFKRQVQKTIGDELTEAFQAAGFSADALRFEVLTTEELLELDRQRRARERLDELMRHPVSAHDEIPASEKGRVDLDALSLEEKFEMVYEAYPVKKGCHDAWRVFRRLDRRGELPGVTTLLKSIKGHQNNDRWWREKMPPLLRNFLTGKKWEDRPYE